MTVRSRIVDSHWWNPLSAALIIITLVGLIIGIRFTTLINDQNRAVAVLNVSIHSQCLTTNATADVWNLLISQAIANEQKSLVDNAVVKQAKIKDLLAIKFPKQVC